MYWAIGGFTAIILSALGVLAVIVRRLHSFDGVPLADHFPPPPEEDQ